MHTISIEQFEGPFDLLLQLVSQEKVSITDISLAQITEDFVRVVHERRADISIDEIADFLVVAARLVYIKSRVLFPDVQDDEEYEAPGMLATQLAIYEQFQKAARDMWGILRQGRVMIGREPVALSMKFAPPRSLDAQGILVLMRGALSRLTHVVPVPDRIALAAISLQERIEFLQEKVKRHGVGSFRTWVADAHSKTEVIVTFLALLELVRSAHISVRQPESFDDILIEHYHI